MSPTLTVVPEIGFEVLVTTTAGAIVGESTSLGGVVIGPPPPGGVPLAVALLCTLPAITSAAVTTCVAAQVVV